MLHRILQLIASEQLRFEQGFSHGYVWGIIAIRQQTRKPISHEPA